MSAIDEMLLYNERCTKEFDAPNASGRPSRRVAIISCMDARMDIHRILGLALGEAHMIRNAGGVVTDDVLRSIVISQRLLGTQSIMVIHHTECGMLSVREDDLKSQIQSEVGIRPSFSLEAFSDLDDELRQSVTRLRSCPFLLHKSEIRGFIYDISTGRLREAPG